MESWDGVGTKTFFPVETRREQRWVFRGRNSQRELLGDGQSEIQRRPLHGAAVKCADTQARAGGSYPQETEI